MSDQLLSADKPLTDLTGDRLGFAPYAGYLAQVVAHRCPNYGLVIAICGPWGSGKSTLINFMLRSLEAIPEQERPYVIHFSPWLFSGESDLTTRFFQQLLSEFAKWGKGFTTLRKTVADYAEIVEKAPIPYAAVSGAVAKAIRPGMQDAHSLKGKIEKLLASKKRRILTVIDDVDRLTAEEVRQLFRVLKAVADFPNMTYLLAFDRQVVTKALDREQATDGEAYLEKIVQATFDVPRIEPLALHKMLFEQLDQVLDGTPDGAFEQTRWGNVFHEGIKHFIETPRDTTRLINVLSATYPPFKNEVNPVDFIGLETLRLFCPVAYAALRNRPEMFHGVSPMRMSAEHEQEIIKSYHEGWLNTAPEVHQEAVKRIMIRIFPRLEGIWANMNYGTDFLPSWRKALRVCSPSRYPVYFHYSLPSGYVSNEEMQSALSIAGNGHLFADKLVALASERNLNGTSRLRTFLEILTDYVEKEIPLDHISGVLHAFMNVGDALLLECDNRVGFYEFGGNELRIGWVLWPLLERLNPDSRFNLLKSSYQQGNAVSLMVDNVSFFGNQQGKYGEKEPRAEAEWLVSAAHLAELEPVVLGKIRAAAAEKSLLETPLFVRALHGWAEWGDPNEVRAWVQEIVSSDGGLALFVSRFGSNTMMHAFSDSVSRTSYHLSPKRLERFIEPSTIIGRARSLADGDSLAGPLRQALAQVVKEYDLIAAGKNPDSPWAFDEEDRD